MVLRVGNISENSDGSLMITAVQDVFGLPATSYATGNQPPAWTPPDERPRPVLDQTVLELPRALLTRTVRGTLAPELATVSPLTMAGRAGRPYPPADVRVNGEYRDTITRSQPLELAWVHRNRLLQADNLVGHIEPGAVVCVRLWKLGELVKEMALDNGWQYPAEGESWGDFDTITLDSRRGSLWSWQGYVFPVV